MENYIGKVQIIPVKNIKLTVVEQKNDKLLIELEDGRYFKSTIENWDKGFTKLNHLSSPLNIVGETATNKDGRKMEVIKVVDRLVGCQQNIKLDVKFKDCGKVVRASYNAWENRKVISPPKLDSDFMKPVDEKIRLSHLGESIINSVGEKVIIDDYINSKNVYVRVGNNIKKCTYKEFKDGVVKSDEMILKRNKEILQQRNLSNERIGEKNMSSNCGIMEIIEYNSTSDIIVKFLDDGTVKKTTYKHFKEGIVESDYLKEKKQQEFLKKQQQIEQEKKEREEYRLRHIGESITLECGKIATIIDWFSTNDISVEIDGEIYKTNYMSFQNKLPSINKMFEKQEMVGTYIENNAGTKIKVLSYNLDDNTFLLELDNGYKFTKDCITVINKAFTTPYDLSYGGVGYLGEKYVPNDYPVIGNMWHSLLDRVVVRKGRKEFKTYEDCSVCDRWLCFSNFVDDMLEMWYDCDEKLEIDKDIKYKGNKVYSPENCLLVPHRINMLFRGWESGDNHATGVEFIKSGEHKGKWKVKPQGRRKGEQDEIFRTGVHKNFKNERDAWEYYKNIKRKYVEKVLREYEGVVPEYILNCCRKRVEDMKFDD